MLKKVLVALTCIVLVICLSVPSFAWEELPEDSSYVSMTWSNRWIYFDTRDNLWVSRERSPTLWSDNDWNSDLVGTVFGYVTPAVIFSDSPLNNPYTLQSATTYYMEYVVIGSGALFSYNANPDLYWFVTKDNLSNVFGDWSNSQIHVTDPLNDNYKVPITNVTTDRSYSETAVGSNTYRIRFAFSTNASVTDLNLSAIMMPCTGYFENTDSYMYISSFSAWYDPTGDVYDTIVSEGINNINNNLVDIQNKIDAATNELGGKLDDVNDNLGNINDALQGDPNDYQDNSGFDGAAGELEDIEGQINDQITGNVTIDGESYEMNGALIGNYKESFMDRWNPQDYEATAGRELARLFDLFYPYVGVAIFLNLTLAVIMSFLRGRSNA